MAGEYGGMLPGHGFPGAFGMPGGPEGGFQPAGPDAWGGEDVAHWGSRESALLPAGNLMPGRGPPLMMEGRGRGPFGRGREGMPGRGGYGRFGRGGRWGPQEEFDGSWEQQSMGDGPGMPGRGSFRGRGPDFGRGGRGAPPGGRWGGRPPGWPGRGRQGEGAEARQPGPDAVAAVRRRASAAARLRAQVSQLQVSRELLGDDSAAAEAYARVMEGGEEQPPVTDVRQLCTHALFAAEGAPVPGPEPDPDADPHAAFEQCLRLYQRAQAGCTVVQSEHGNFLLPAQ